MKIFEICAVCKKKKLFMDILIGESYCLDCANDFKILSKIDINTIKIYIKKAK